MTIGPPGSSTCQDNLKLFTDVCKELGVSLALEKVEGPTTCLTLDTHRMEMRLPDGKLMRIQGEIERWLQKKAAKRQILSLVGLLQHATKVVRYGRIFVARMYTTEGTVLLYKIKQGTQV